MNHVSLADQGPTAEDFLRDVLDGLSRPDKTLPCKYFYDKRGSLLFDQICESNEYYLTRCELEIMRSHSAEMAAVIGSHCILVEFGSGSSLKTKYLLDHLSRPLAYIPVDISAQHLQDTAAKLVDRYPGLRVLPLSVDFTQSFDLPPVDPPENGAKKKTVVYFPGSTIGNFAPPDAVELLRRIAKLCGTGGGLLIGVDLKKSAKVLEHAYDDAGGATRDFNLNLLARINEELGADFSLPDFEHRAFYNADKGRVEMHLVSKRDQVVIVQDRPIEFVAGETIHTESSYKHSPQEFQQLAAQAGFQVDRVWTDSRELFSVQYLTVS